MLDTVLSDYYALFLLTLRTIHYEVNNTDILALHIGK